MLSGFSSMLPVLVPVALLFLSQVIYYLIAIFIGYDLANYLVLGGKIRLTFKGRYFLSGIQLELLLSSLTVKSWNGKWR